MTEKEEEKRTAAQLLGSLWVEALLIGLGIIFLQAREPVLEASGLPIF